MIKEMGGIFQHESMFGQDFPALIYIFISSWIELWIANYLL